ncbi:16S rRNA (uracil(1498)-N(3))-methyltransferase [bacterium]|nr:16S rRNA (uracil(1498)-N(3))-methyltransferase [bacterium]
MPHFFIEQNSVSDNKIIISDKENYRHIARALRAKKGEKLLLIDNKQIQYETIITDITPTEIECSIKKSYPSKRDLEFDLYLAQSPLRSDSQLTVMEKATELGIRGVYPIITDNCSVQYDIAKKKVEKWQKVMYEASKQCERAKIPTCFELIRLENIFEKDFGRIIVFGERSTEISLKNYLKENPIKKSEKILLLIGPEGGFSQREFNIFKEKNYPIITLGDLILKADTAVTIALGDIIYEYNG